MSAHHFPVTYHRHIGHLFRPIDHGADIVGKLGICEWLLWVFNSTRPQCTVRLSGSAGTAQRLPVSSWTLVRRRCELHCSLLMPRRQIRLDSLRQVSVLY